MIKINRYYGNEDLKLAFEEIQNNQKEFETMLTYI